MELWLEEVICGYCPCKFLSLTMELWLEEIICATNFYCNKFLKYMYKELVPIENLGRWIGPRRRNGPLSECPLSASAIFIIFSFCENILPGEILFINSLKLTKYFKHSITLHNSKQIEIIFLNASSSGILSLTLAHELNQN